MNFDLNICIDMQEDSNRRARRRGLVRTALVMCAKQRFPKDEDVDGIIADLVDRYGEHEDTDAKIVSALSEQYIDSYFKRKRDEENREAFKDELAARVWETVKQMTWFTDAQKVIPEDLGARVEQKRIDEKNHLNDLRAGLFR